MTTKIERGTVLWTTKIVSLILGAVVLVLGLYSHYTSSWVKKIRLPRLPSQMYKICGRFRITFSGEFADRQYPDRSCPPIGIERYFVGTIITCFVLSVIFFAVDFTKKGKSRIIFYFNAGYHVLGGIVLLFAGVLYLISAIQILGWMDDDHFDGDDWEYFGIYHKFQFRYLEKHIASVLTIIQGVLFLLIARIVFRNASCARTNSQAEIVQPIVAQAQSNYEQSVVHGVAHVPLHLQNIDYDGVSRLTAQPDQNPVLQSYGVVYSNNIK